MKQLSRKNKIAIIIGLLWVLGLIFSLFIYKNRLYLRTFDADELSVYSTAPSDTLEMDAAIVDDSANTLFVTQNATIETPALCFEPGTYVFAISYQTDSDNDVFMVVSDTTMDANGNVGCIYAQETMSSTENRVRVEATIPSYTTNVHIRVLHQGGDINVTETVWRNAVAYKDPVILYMLVSFIAALMLGIYYLFVIKRDKKEVFGAACVILVMTCIASLPVFNDFLIKGHDLDFHLARLEGITSALRQGQFPVWINPVQTGGYGYSSSVMYPQLFLYFPALLHVLGLSLMNSYKVLIFTINIMAALCGYIGFRFLFKRHDIGLIGCVMWAISMYRLDSLFIRAAIGEALAIAFAPVLVWGFYELFWGNVRYWWVATLAFTGVIGSHLLSTEMYTVVIFVFFIFSMIANSDRLIRLGYTCLAAGVCLLLNLYYIVPFLSYFLKGYYNKSTTQLSEIYLKDRTVYWSQIFNTFAHHQGKGNIAAGTTVNEMPLSLGLISLVGIIFIVYVFCRYKDKQNTAFMMHSFAAFVILAFGISWLVPWDVLMNISVLYKAVSSIQFVWRVLGIAAVFILVATLAAARIWVENHPDKNVLFILAAAILSIILGWPAIDTAIDMDGYSATEQIAFNNSTDYLYLFADGDLDNAIERGICITTSDEAVGITDFSYEGTKVSCSVKADSDISGAYIDLPLYAYPGYKSLGGNDEIAISTGNNGLVEVALPAMKAGDVIDVSVGFKAPAIWYLAYVISIGSGLCMIAAAVIKKRKSFGDAD